jgi:hypothetical protein
LDHIVNALTNQKDPTDAQYRRAPLPSTTIKPSTVQWLAALPAAVRPKHLPVRFVRIANTLSDLWQHPRACSEYFQALLIDQRGSRHGFPIEVGLELATLKNYFETDVNASPQTVWDEIVGHRRGG